MAEKFGTPRRTLLTEAHAPARPAPRATTGCGIRRPCARDRRPADLVVLSTTGRAVRVDLPEGTEPPVAGDPAQQARRHPVDGGHHRRGRTRRDHLARAAGAVHAGRPARPCPPTRCSSPPGPGSPTTSASPTRRSACSAWSRSSPTSPIALGTAQGVVKRVTAGGYPEGPEFEVIALKPGDEVVGVGQGADAEELVFVTTDAQLLHFAAVGRAPAGRRCGRHGGDQPRRRSPGALLRRGRLRHPTSSSRRSRRRPRRCPATDPGRAKVSALRRVPGQGARDRRGPRAHLPQGRERARARLGRPAARFGGLARRHRADAAGCRGAARRIRNPAGWRVGSIGRAL